MKVTNEQFEKAANIYWSTGNFRDAIESLPEPLPRLRPLTEMPPEVPEGALRLLGFVSKYGDGWILDKTSSTKDTHFLDVLPPLPESPKPSLQDELVTALESIWPFLEEDDGHGATAPAYQSAINQVRSARAKAKGGQQ